MRFKLRKNKKVKIFVFLLKILLDKLIKILYYIQAFGFIWRGVAQLVAHVVWDHGVGGSSPFTPTILTHGPLAQLVRATGS